MKCQICKKREANSFMWSPLWLSAAEGPEPVCTAIECHRTLPTLVYGKEAVREFERIKEFINPKQPDAFKRISEILLNGDIIRGRETYYSLKESKVNSLSLYLVQCNGDYWIIHYISGLNIGDNLHWAGKMIFSR